MLCGVLIWSIKDGILSLKRKKPWAVRGQINRSYGAIFGTSEIPKGRNTRFASLRCVAISPTGANGVIICCKGLLCDHCTRSAKSLGVEHVCVCASNLPSLSPWAFWVKPCTLGAVSNSGGVEWRGKSAVAVRVKPAPTICPRSRSSSCINSPVMRAGSTGSMAGRNSRFGLEALAAAAASVASPVGQNLPWVYFSMFSGRAR